MNKNSKIVFVYSIPRKSVFGIDQWVNDTSGRKLKRIKIGKAVDRIQALYSARVGGLANGISYKPWMENGVQVTDDKGNKLTLQDKYEKKYNLPKGYLTNKAWRKGDSLKEEDMTYYQKKSWTLRDGATALDLNTMEGELGYMMFLDSKFIANSEEEWRTHKWPKATHYIALENESESIKFKRTARKSAAFAALAAKKMDLPTKRKFVSLLELASSTTRLSEEAVHNLLFEYIDKTTFTPGSNIDKFEELWELYKTANGKEEFEARYLLKKAVDSRVIYVKQGAYKWPKPDGLITLGERLSEAVDFITDPKKSSLVEDLEASIKAKLTV